MMTLQNPSDWVAESTEAISRLADRPWALFLVLVTINAIAFPYTGINYDARLYSVQVLNRVEAGSYADDIFFRYGSQDDYSLFSHLAAPLVGWLGLSVAFFVIFILCKSLLIFGMMRLVRTLLPSKTAATLALVYGMAYLTYYGGNHMLYVQENFLTSRMPACALVLIGIDLMLRGRPMLSGLTILFALGNHPLMGFGGLLVWIGFQVWTHLGVKILTGLIAGIAILAVAVLAIQPIGTRCFGEMDDAWRQAIYHASPFNFASDWHWTTWLSLALQLTIAAIAAWKFGIDSDRGRFLCVLMFVTMTGGIGAIVAERLPYALLFQGQPYRVLWLLAFLHVPLVFWLCGEWSASVSWVAKFAGCALLAYLCCINGMAAELVLPVLLFPLLAVAFRGLDPEPRHPAWLMQAVQVSIVLGAAGWGAYKFALLIHGWADLATLHTEYRDMVEIIIRSLGPVVFCAVSCMVLVVLLRRDWRPEIAYGLGFMACLGTQVLCYALPRTDYYVENCTQYRADLRRVHALVHEGRDAGQPLPTVYCNLGCLDYVWIDLHSKCYLDWWQAGNFMFRREMAMEGQRRARVVGPFEIAHYRLNEDQLAPGYKALIARFFQTDFDRPPPSQDDLVRLCAEPGLDYVVLDQPIEGVYGVQVGKLHVYSCAEVGRLRHSTSASPRER